MTEENKEELEVAIDKVIEEQDDQHHLSYKSRTFMVHALRDFVNDAVSKFIDGQIKHGGSIFERDLVFERKQEAIDSFWYSAAEEHNKTINENKI